MENPEYYAPGFFVATRRRKEGASAYLLIADRMKLMYVLRRFGLGAVAGTDGSGSMNWPTTFLFAVISCCTMAVGAELVVNGDMSAVTYADGGNHADFGDLNQGWAVKTTSAINLTVNPGAITWDGSSVSLLEDSLAQINSVTWHNGETITLSFDWTPAVGASSTNTSLDYQVVGWIQNTTPADTDAFFKNINGNSKKVSGLAGNATVVDLRTGIDLGTGDPTPSFGTVPGIAGVTTNAVIEVDLSGYTRNDVSDYDYIGVRFSLHGDQSDLSARGSTLDQVSMDVLGDPPPVHTGAVSVVDFFTDTISNVSATVSIVDPPYNADGMDTLDDSAAVQAAIDAMSAMPNGGVVSVPPGTFYLNEVYLKSDVHVVVDPAATLVLAGTSGSLFYLGLDKDGVNALVTISNISIRASSGTYTVDISHAPPNPNKAQFVRGKNIDNFLVADFVVLDNYTALSSVTLNTADHNGQWFQPRNGVVINGDIVDAHYGYGLIQAQACTNMLFQDLAGTGGITLRLETGAVPYDAPASIKLHEVYGRNVSITNGHGAAMMGPHYRINGHVDLDGLHAVSSLYAVSAGDGFVNAEEEAAGYEPGHFAGTCVIKNVHAVYGENAGYKRKNFDDIPCELRHLITPAPWMSSFIYRGPASIAANSNTTRVAFSNVTQEGFLHRSNAIMSKADEIDNCPGVPVSGIVLSETNHSMFVATTVELSAVVSPAGSSDPSVIWSSDAPSVAMVDLGGVVMGVSEGTATVSATTVDGSHSASCVVVVSGGGGGSWSELLHDDFESGWGHWTNGWGNQSEGVSISGLSNTHALGTQCVALSGPTNRSVMHVSVPLDLRDYSNLKIDFSYLADGFGSEEDFWVQFSSDNGLKWQMIHHLVKDRDFQNGVRGNASFLIDAGTYGFSSQCRLRIGNDVDGGDVLHVDNVTVSVFEQTDWGKLVQELDLTGDANADRDGDGQPDLFEFALGGEAGNSNVVAAAPVSTLVDDTIHFSHPVLTNGNAGVSYIAEWSEDLISGVWTSDWTSVSSAGSPREHQLDWMTGTNIFLRLRLEQP